MNVPLGWALVILLSGSIFFNEWVAMVNRRSNGDHPLAAAQVAVGVLYTITMAWAVDGERIGIWTMLWCFVASGSPMLVGDVARWIGRQK